MSFTSESIACDSRPAIRSGIIGWRRIECDDRSPAQEYGSEYSQKDLEYTTILADRSGSSEPCDDLKNGRDVPYTRIVDGFKPC